MLDSDSCSLCLEIMQVCVSEDLAFPKRSLGEMHDLAQTYVMKKAFSGAHCAWCWICVRNEFSEALCLSYLLPWV